MIKSRVSEDEGAHPGGRIGTSKKDVPYSISESFKMYFSGKPMTYYENILLSGLSFYPKAANNRRARTIDTPIDDKGNYIHEFYVENTLPPEDPDKPLEIVLVHGYGAALGFFYKNFEGLTSIPGTKLHAIDMLGFGLSSRPDFPNISGETIEGVKESEDFFIDSLEQWRIKRGIKGPFVLMAHSLGGYLACPYYLKFGKGIVSKMVLMSPVGVERSDSSFYEETASNKQKEQTYTREVELDTDTEDEDDEYNLDLTSITSQSADTEISELMTQVRGSVQPGKFLANLWRKNYSPLQIIRFSGPFAPKLTAQWTWLRFRSIDDDEEIRKVNNYTSKVFLAKGSGEYGLTRILAPGAMAKLPLLDRIPGNIDIDTLWLYGQYDWMSKNDGYEMCNEINRLNKGKSRGHARFRVISNAGHHLYVDNKDEFEMHVLKFLKNN